MPSKPNSDTLIRALTPKGWKAADAMPGRGYARLINPAGVCIVWAVRQRSGGVRLVFRVDVARAPAALRRGLVTTGRSPRLNVAPLGEVAGAPARATKASNVAGVEQATALLAWASENAPSKARKRTPAVTQDDDATPAESEES